VKWYYIGQDVFWNFETNVAGLDFVLFVGRIRTRIFETRASGDVLSIVHDSRMRTLNKRKEQVINRACDPRMPSDEE
jgi:hypothetical protein